jgi:hypothetical protein
MTHRRNADLPLFSRYGEDFLVECPAQMEPDREHLIQIWLNGANQTTLMSLQENTD